MLQFWTLLKESIIVQSLLTLGFSGTCVYLWVTGRSVPDQALQALWVVLGFWFGSKVQHTLAKSKEGGK